MPIDTDPYPHIPVLRGYPEHDPLPWLRSSRDHVEAELLRHGALMLPGVLSDADGLATLAGALGYRAASLAEESSPRSRVSGDVFTSTDYPAAYPIQLHCEYSYGARWPMRLLFGCLVAPESGGQTPVADMRAVLARMDPAVAARFRRSGVLYRRNFVAGVGVDWRTAFGTSSRAAVDRYCTANGIRAIWTGGDSLRTEQIGPAILRHPITGEEVWFNHAFFFNVQALEPASLRDFMLGEDPDTLSTNTFHGDGEPIDARTIEHLRAVIRDCTCRSDWRQGDVLLVDNMLMAHGRAPFTGARQVVVHMADAMSRADHAATAADLPPTDES